MSAETLEHAIRLCDLLAIDLTRLAEDEPWIAGLIADCAEHRQQIANRLRFIAERANIKKYEQADH